MIETAPMTEDDLLNARLAAPDEPYITARQPQNSACDGPPRSSRQNESDQEMSQWLVRPNGIRRPASATIQKLAAGLYTVSNDELGVYFNLRQVVTDEWLDLPDAATGRVLDGISKFWRSRERYAAHGLVYKRGVLLWGPPGSGKTVTVSLLARELIAMDGLVVFCEKPSLCAEGLRIIRAIEPRRPLIVVMEDVDETILRHGEHELLALLDGEFAIDNVVYVATTNYPERLGARIVNRPSRFDERVFVDMPGEAARQAYLMKALSAHTVDRVEEEYPEGFDVAGARRLRIVTLAEAWARDTKGLSIAHLRELVAGVLCLEQPYEDVLRRLRSMAERPKDVDGFARRRIGL